MTVTNKDKELSNKMDDTGFLYTIETPHGVEREVPVVVAKEVTLDFAEDVAYNDTSNTNSTNNNKNGMNNPTTKSRKDCHRGCRHQPHSGCRYRRSDTSRCQRDGKGRANVGLSVLAGMVGLIVCGPIAGVVAGVGIAIATKDASRKRCERRKNAQRETMTVVTSTDDNRSLISVSSHPAPTAPIEPVAAY